MASEDTTTMKMSQFNRSLLLTNLESAGLACEAIHDTIYDYKDRVTYLSAEDDDLSDIDTNNRTSEIRSDLETLLTSVLAVLALSLKPKGK